MSGGCAWPFSAVRTSGVELSAIAEYTCEESYATCNIVVVLPEVRDEFDGDRQERFEFVAALSTYAEQCAKSCKNPTFTQFVKAYGPAFVPRVTLKPFDCRKVEYDDGDSFTCDDKNIRILGYDTAEITHPEQGICKDQHPDGRVAALRLRDAFSKSGRITVIPSGGDPFGRTLGYVELDGQLFGLNLVRDGLAYATPGTYGSNGLPEYERRFIEAAQAAKTPAFENPKDWRRANQIKGQACPPKGAMKLLNKLR